jgi:hypothetical protein
VEVVSRQQEGPPAGASGKRKASSEAGSTEDEENRHAVLAYVVGQLNEQLFTELMNGFHASDNGSDSDQDSDMEDAGVFEDSSDVEGMNRLVYDTDSDSSF